MLPSPPAEMSLPFVNKRKRSQIEAEEIRDHSFHLENLSTYSSISFEPLTKLLRAHLPLSWLAATPKQDVLLAGSVLRGIIKHVTSWDYSVLIARQIPNGGLYVLEKVDQDVFIVHPLQPFVSERWVQDASFGAGPAVTTQMILHHIPDPELHQVTSSLPNTPTLGLDTQSKIPKNRKGVAARKSILDGSIRVEDVLPSPLLEQMSLQGSPKLPKTQEDSLAVDLQVGQEEREQGISTGIIAPDGQQLTPVDVVQLDMLSPEYLRKRYLETLYCSKLSLAFYSKGPLSRARVRARAVEASLTLPDLAAFYRDSVLPAKKMDLKYKDSVRSTISRIVQNDDLVMESGRKKTKKKTKFGKDALWPEESVYIRKWWQDSHLSSLDAERQQAHLEQAIASLRMREAQMQIIIILEILSIEAKAKTLCNNQPPTRPVGDISAVKLESVEQSPTPAEIPEKISKKRSVETDLGILADKLCIWHSIGLEDNFGMSIMTGEMDIDSVQQNTRDRLRNFCIDVLIPFYSSKLPVICKSLCKTLAGTEIFDQVQKAARLKKEPAKASTSGMATVQRSNHSRSNTLERIVKQSSGSAIPRPPTPLTVPQLKREPSEPPKRTLSRQTSVSFSNREVDLVADAQITATKKRKLDLVAIQKQELAAAIEALKKPSRQAVGKAYMDDVESRVIQSKKPVLVTATPRASRKLALDQAHPGHTSNQAAEEPLIPSSSVKPSKNRMAIPNASSSSKKREILAAIADTPKKPVSSQLFAALAKCQNRVVGEQPLLTPVKQRSLSEMFRTPTKAIPRGQENAFCLTEEALQTMERAMKLPVTDSIYDKLGWNDEDEV